MPRVPTPRAARACFALVRGWRSLVLEPTRALTSSFTSQAPPLVGSTPIRQLRLSRALHLRFTLATRFTCPARTAPDMPGKRPADDDPGRLPSCPRTACTLFRGACGSVRATSGLNPLIPSAPVRPRFHRRPRQRFDDFARASVTFAFHSARLAAPRARDARCVRPTSASHHSTTSTRVSWVPDRVGEVALSSVRGSGVSRRRFRFGGSTALFDAREILSRPLPTVNRASDTPVASPSEKRRRFRTHRFVRGRQDRLRHAFVKRARLHDPECLPSTGDSAPRNAAPTHYRRRDATDLVFLRSRGFATAIRCLDALSRPAAFGAAPR